jgi:hypothetical protein
MLNVASTLAMVLMSKVASVQAPLASWFWSTQSTSGSLMARPRMQLKSKP